MADPQTFWLNASNALLGIVVVACAAALLLFAAREVIARLRTNRALSRELNGDMKRWFGSGSGPRKPHR